MHNMATTDQVIPNPTGKGGFADHPENRSDGGWKKEENIPYLMNKFGRMTDDELDQYETENANKLTQFEKTALVRVRESSSRTEQGLKEAREVMDRTSGKAKEFIDHTTNGKSLNNVKDLTDEELDERIRSIIKNRT